MPPAGICVPRKPVSVMATMMIVQQACSGVRMTIGQEAARGLFNPLKQPETGKEKSSKSSRISRYTSRTRKRHFGSAQYRLLGRALIASASSFELFGAGPTGDRCGSHRHKAQGASARRRVTTRQRRQAGTPARRGRSAKPRRTVVAVRSGGRRLFRGREGQQRGRAPSEASSEDRPLRARPRHSMGLATTTCDPGKTIY